MAKDIRKFYFPKNKGRVDENSLIELANMMSDTNQIYGINKAAKIWHRKSFGNTFMYRFSMENQLNEYRRKSGANERNIPGASHGDDLYYLFR